MADVVSDGQVRQVFDSNSGVVYKVTVPTGWVESHQNQLQLTDGYVWGDLYSGNPPNIQELPDDIKEQFGLNAPVPVQGRAREEEDPVGAERRRRTGGKSKKHPTARRRRSSKARKARNARKSRKSRNTRRR
jgi:type IV secretory pathway VirB10-like protein